MAFRGVIIGNFTCKRRNVNVSANDLDVVNSRRKMEFLGAKEVWIGLFFFSKKMCRLNLN